MSPARLVARLVPVALVLVAAAACQSEPRRCGRVSASGGPPILDTREAEACDYARVLMHDFLTEVNDGEIGRKVYDAASGWDDAVNREELRHELSRDVSAEFAAAIVEVVRHTLEKSRRPSRNASGPTEAGIIAAAVNGMRIALDESYIPDVGILGTDTDS